MQPYYEAKGRNKQQIGNVTVPSLVTQIADGENGGVMMNEFPSAFFKAWHENREQGGGKSGVVGLNGTEYLEIIEAAGVNPDDYPICQGINQHKIWHLVDPDSATPEKVESAIAQLKQTDHNFHMDGASWTNDLSWVKGYENVLEPMNLLSAAFHKKYDALLQQDATVTKQFEYQQALLYNLLLQTSCFRYWGQGTWTDYARELYNRGAALMK
jgi:hypothetical protein